MEVGSAVYQVCFAIQNTIYFIFIIYSPKLKWGTIHRHSRNVGPLLQEHDPDMLNTIHNGFQEQFVYLQYQIRLMTQSRVFKGE